MEAPNIPKGSVQIQRGAPNVQPKSVTCPLTAQIEEYLSLHGLTLANLHVTSNGITQSWESFVDEH